jgi:hypothetical protein
MKMVSGGYNGKNRRDAFYAVALTGARTGW